MHQPNGGSFEGTDAIVGRVLVVDDESLVRQMLERVLTRAGHQVVTVGAPGEALDQLSEGEFDLILTDLSMPGQSGIDLMREVRVRDRDLPVLFLTGQPSVDSAASAVELGAFRYLLKPIQPSALTRAVRDALHARSLARATNPLRHREALELSFQAALDSLWIAFQPILSAASGETFGFEALMRSREPSLPHPGAVLDAAEKLGYLHRLGRVVRERAARAIAEAPRGPCFFVNVHPADLADTELFDRSAPLSAYASRIILELTERSSLEGVSGLEGRLADLRGLGYRIAVDDLGAGYAGLSYFASVCPDLIKIDMSLVRGIDADPVKQRVVQALAELGRSMGIEIVGEGVETVGERDKLLELQCTHLQGYLFAKPAAPFPSAVWGG
ncbi:MAG: EAL domain-containing protein [Polyangiaceae bacterium]|nr:EAL domain-containing protein [Polyangiaceae bacterium]MCW5789832.1 EAL domain-containing protein [Polyangiaceae bacterium]